MGGERDWVAACRVSQVPVGLLPSWTAAVEEGRLWGSKDIHCQEDMGASIIWAMLPQIDDDNIICTTCMHTCN